MAVCSCSNLPQGYFNAYAAMAQRDDLDALFEDPWEFKNGQMTIPDKPGLGLTINEEALKANLMD